MDSFKMREYVLPDSPTLYQKWPSLLTIKVVVFTVKW
jgi:hypothetical protein